ncbi:hypothetical protein [uncultured Porphyromonas sp.]|uniref:hypothetical protein n=1 Tax=uncultured Porphyromonas sp. TaxID=159274 RepID=UPI0026132C23|nr:hypothetical protein [uncultured Porphyromonas sp.]
MQKTIYTTLISLLLLTLGLAACKPSTPVDEVQNKNHDDPKKIELILFDCHFHGNKVHATPEQKGVKYLTREQVMILEEVPGKGWQISSKGVDRFIVQGGKEGVKSPDLSTIIDPAKRDWTDQTFIAEDQAGLANRQYGLIIKMYDKEGKEITGQFATNGEDKRHQFFFTARNIRPTKFGDPTMKFTDGDCQYMYYYYFDTNPWDKTLYDGAKYTGISNPIGLKGFMEFPVTEIRFELQLTLLHARSSKFSGKDGRPSPFYGMTPKQRATDVVDINLKGIPFVVFANAGEYLSTNTHDLSKLKPEERLLVEKLSDAACITEQEALDDLWYFPFGETPEHSLSEGRYL